MATKKKLLEAAAGSAGGAGGLNVEELFSTDLWAGNSSTQQITNGLIRIFGVKNTKTAVMLTGFIVGITMFYSVGFVILVPLVFTIASATGLSLIAGMIISPIPDRGPEAMSRMSLHFFLP